MMYAGWEKGEVGDGAYFYEYLHTDISSRRRNEDGTFMTEGSRAVLNFSGTSIDLYEEENVTVEMLNFYRLEGTEEKMIKLGEVSARYYSEVMLTLNKALG